MLAVARRTEPAIDWVEGKAEALPFPDHGFDAVVSQFGLMYFEDRRAALREMWRVLRPGGRMVVAVWDFLGNLPGFAALEALFRQQLGEEAAASLRAPFVLGDRAELGGLFEAAKIADGKIETRHGTARFRSIEDWVRTEVKGWTLAEQVDDEGYQRLQRSARERLRDFTDSDGSVAFPVAAHFVVARKPREPASPRPRSGAPADAVSTRVLWSGRLDSNQRPAVPKTAALPGCATPRRLCL